MDLWSRLNSLSLERRPIKVDNSLLKICLNQQRLNHINATSTGREFNEPRSVVCFDELLSNKIWNLNNRSGSWRQVDHRHVPESFSSQIQNNAASYDNHLYQYPGDWRMEAPQPVFRFEEEEISNRMAQYKEFVHKGERFKNYAEFLLCRRVYEDELRKIRLEPAYDDIDSFNDSAEYFSTYNIFGNDDIFKFATVLPKPRKFSHPNYLTKDEYDVIRKEFSSNGWDVDSFNVKNAVEFPPLKIMPEQSKLLEVFLSPMQQKNVIQNPVAKPLRDEGSARDKRGFRKKVYNYCVFCINNKEPPEIYNDHILKDEEGKVVCPILRSYVCPICAAKGENAHTFYHCPNRNSVTLEHIQKSSQNDRTRNIIKKRPSLGKRNIRR